jgi:hypothetical protein
MRSMCTGGGASVRMNFDGSTTMAPAALAKTSTPLRRRTPADCDGPWNSQRPKPSEWS